MSKQHKAINKKQTAESNKQKSFSKSNKQKTITKKKKQLAKSNCHCASAFHIFL